MTAWEKIQRDDARLRAIDARRAAARKRQERAPVCPVCSGRIQFGRCKGDGAVACGLYFPQRDFE